MADTTITPAAQSESRPRARIDLATWLSIGWLVALVALALLAPVLPFVPDPTKVNVSHIGQGFTAEHWLGADELGRDIFSRVLYGAQASIGISVAALLIAVVVGGLLGLLAGYFRGWLESVIMFIADVVLSFPGLVLVLALVTFLGQGTWNLIIALALLIMPGIARLVRAIVLTVAERDYVLVARAIGARHFRIVFREVLPAVVLPLLSLSLLMVGLIIVVAGALDFLGFGVQPPTPTWGGMIASGVQTLSRMPLVALVPSAFLFLTILAANTIGDALRSGFEVRGSVL